MLDIIKEGIKLNQSLALLPLKAARRLVDDKNTNAKQMIDVAEDFVSMPFVAAAKAIDSGSRCSGEEKARETCPKQYGPSVKNIWVNPEVQVIADSEIQPDERRAVLAVTGLLCGGWVDRVKKTLEGFEVVSAVEFFPDREQFEVAYRSDVQMGEEFRTAVIDVIIFPGVRRFLGGVGDQLNNSVEGEQ